MERVGELMTAKELAEMFSISVTTLYRELKDGPRKEDNSLDFRAIPDRFVGGKRFWLRSAAEALFDEFIEGEQ